MKHIILEKVDFVEPYRVQMLPSLSLKAVPEVYWTFSKLADAIEAGEDLAKRNDSKLVIFGNEIVEL